MQKKKEKCYRTENRTTQLKIQFNIIKKTLTAIEFWN